MVVRSKVNFGKIFGFGNCIKVILYVSGKVFGFVIVFNFLYLM